MAGKSNRGRGKKGSHNASNSSNLSEAATLPDVPVKDNTVGTSEPAKAEGVEISTEGESTSANSGVKEQETADTGSQQKQGTRQDKCFIYFTHSISKCVSHEKLVINVSVSYW